LADADDAALRVVEEVDLDVPEVGRPRELVRVHVGVDLQAARAVEAPVLEEAVVDAADDAAVDLALAEEAVDDEATVGHGDGLHEPHVAGLDVDFDLGELRAADALVAHALPLVLVRALGDRLLAEERAGLLPGEALRGGGLREAPTPLRLEVGRVDADRRRRLLEELRERLRARHRDPEAHAP